MRKERAESPYDIVRGLTCLRKTPWRRACVPPRRRFPPITPWGGSHDNRREPSKLPDLTPAQYRILGIIAASGGNPITKSDTARTAGCVVRTIDRAVCRLCEAGLIERVYNHDSVGGQVGNSYRLRPRQGESARERIRPDP